MRVVPGNDNATKCIAKCKKSHRKSHADSTATIDRTVEHNNFSRDFKTVNFLPRNQRRVLPFYLIP